MTNGVDLSRFDNSWYTPGRSLLVRVAWLLLSRFFFETFFPWPNALKRGLLRLLGASVGRKVVIKPHVRFKYPWKIAIGDYSWIGEDVWIDSLDSVTVGRNACVSQGAFLETGNHDWSDPAFGLMTRPIVIEDGAWVGAKSTVLPGTVIETHAVVSAGAVVQGRVPALRIVAGNPAVEVRSRELRTSNRISS